MVTPHRLVAHRRRSWTLSKFKFAIIVNTVQWWKSPLVNSSEGWHRCQFDRDPWSRLKKSPHPPPPNPPPPKIGLTQTSQQWSLHTTDGSVFNYLLTLLISINVSVASWGIFAVCVSILLLFFVCASSSYSYTEQNKQNQFLFRNFCEDLV